MITGRRWRHLRDRGPLRFTKSDPRVLKFDKNGSFINPGAARGPSRASLRWPTESRSTLRVNYGWRIVKTSAFKFSTRTAYSWKQLKYAGLPCNTERRLQNIHMVNGHAAPTHCNWTLNGKVLAALGKSEKGVGEFIEAHAVSVGPTGEIWVSDTVNHALQKFVKSGVAVPGQETRAQAFGQADGRPCEVRR